MSATSLDNSPRNYFAPVEISHQVASSPYQLTNLMRFLAIEMLCSSIQTRLQLYAKNTRFDVYLQLCDVRAFG